VNKSGFKAVFELLPSFSFNQLKDLRKQVNIVLGEKYPASFGKGRRFANPNRVPSDELVFTVLSAVKSEKARLVLCCQAFLGLRISDAVRLEWRDFDFERGFFFKTEQKTKKFVSKPIPAQLLGLLLDYRKHCKTAALFAGRNRFVNAGWVRNELRHALDVLGVNGTYAKSADGRALREFSSHALRRWYITKVAENASNFFLATELAGHSSPKTTMQYYAGSDQKKREFINKSFNGGTEK